MRQTNLSHNLRAQRIPQKVDPKQAITVPSRNICRQSHLSTLPSQQEFRLHERPSVLNFAKPAHATPVRKKVRKTKVSFSEHKSRPLARRSIACLKTDRSSERLQETSPLFSRNHPYSPETTPEPRSLLACALSPSQFCSIPSPPSILLTSSFP
jgi:hypothetical protein